MRALESFDFECSAADCIQRYVPAASLRIAADDIAEMYARARDARADRMAAEILEIADDTEGDMVTVTTKSGETYLRGDSAKVSRAALRVDARKWLMARMSPRKYGDRVAHEHDRNGNPLPRALIVVRSTADPSAGSKAAGREQHEGD